MKTTRRDFIKLALAGIVALFTARFSKPSVEEKWDWDALEDWGAAYPSTLDELAGFEIDDYADPVEFARKGVMWYVSKDGDDANSGRSPDDAFLTPGAALRATTSGANDVVICCTGDLVHNNKNWIELSKTNGYFSFPPLPINEDCFELELLSRCQ